MEIAVVFNFPQPPTADLSNKFHSKRLTIQSEADFKKKLIYQKILLNSDLRCLNVIHQSIGNQKPNRDSRIIT